MSTTAPTGTVPTDNRPAVETTRTHRFFPQLEGMRAVAALGVLTTHVAFQTRAVEIPVLGQVLGRLDLAVALFFALSGFLLWRPWVACAHGVASRPRIRRYLAHRFVRIWPAYVVVVVLVLTLLPDAKTASLTVWVANLTLTQVFVPLSLTAGLTQMWSLSVEVSFYLLLPLFGLALLRMRGARSHRRILVLAALAALTLTWGVIAEALPVSDGVEPKNWVIGHLPWFLAGLILAELSGIIELSGVLDGDGDLGDRPRWVRTLVALGARRWLMFAVLVVAYGLACTPLAGPTGLGDISAWQFATKMALGAVCGLALLAPLVCSAGPFRFLASPTMQALGRWSYGIFIWHLVVLSVVFGLFGIPAFSGHTLVVWTLTVVLTVGISAVSYALIEEPARQWLLDRERPARR